MSDVMQQNAGYGRSGRAVPTHPLANAAPVLEQALPQPRADQIPVSDGGGRCGTRLFQNDQSIDLGNQFVCRVSGKDIVDCLSHARKLLEPVVEADEPARIDQIGPLEIDQNRVMPVISVDEDKIEADAIVARRLEIGMGGAFPEGDRLGVDARGSQVPDHLCKLIRIVGERIDHIEIRSGRRVRIAVDQFLQRAACCGADLQMGGRKCVFPQQIGQGLAFIRAAFRSKCLRRCANHGGPPNSGAFFPKPEVVSTRRLLKPRWPTTKTLLTVST